MTDWNSSTEKPTLLAAIDPARGEKYSPNLHMWMKKRRRWQISAFHDMDKGEFYLGFMDDTASLIGARVWSILQHGRRTKEFSYSMFGAGDGNRRTPVPAFWERYIAVGRCLFDPEHVHTFQNAEGRYDETEGTRLCTWCGARYRREGYVIQRYRWVPDERH